MDAGAHAQRGAELRHPHEHVGGKLLRPGEIDRGEPEIDRVGSRPEPSKAVRPGPSVERRRIAGAVAVHHGNESDDGGGGDQGGDEPLLEPVKDAVEHGKHGVSPGPASFTLALCLSGTGAGCARQSTPVSLYRIAPFTTAAARTPKPCRYSR